MGRPKKTITTPDEASDYRQLYENTVAERDNLMGELDRARREYDVLEEDYRLAEQSNQEFSARLAQLERSIEQYTEVDSMELGEDEVIVTLDPKDGEVKTIMGPDGKVEVYREGRINGVPFKHLCGVPIPMSREHAILLGQIKG
jgi:predicted nuclease with TOPRIM domain